MNCPHTAVVIWIHEREFLETLRELDASYVVGWSLIQDLRQERKGISRRLNGPADRMATAGSRL
jgi:hypothetical protein